jgi:hypothetical protein
MGQRADAREDSFCASVAVTANHGLMPVVGLGLSMP